MKKAFVIICLLMFSTAAVAQTRKSAPAKKEHSVHSKRKAKVRQVTPNKAKRPLHPSRRVIPPKPPTPGKRGALHPRARKKK